MKKILMILVVFLFTCYSFGQTITTTIDYTTSTACLSGQTACFCNYFSSTADPREIGGIKHYATSGGCQFDGSVIKMPTHYDMEVNSQGSGFNNIDEGTAYILKYSFKKNYKYTISIDAGYIPENSTKFPRMALTAWSDLPDPNITNPQGCGAVSEYMRAKNGYTQLFGPIIDYVDDFIPGGITVTSGFHNGTITTHNANSFAPTEAFNYLAIIAYNGNSPSTLAAKIKKIVIKESPAVTFNINPSTLNVQGCTSTQQTFTVNTVGIPTGTISYVWHPGVGWQDQNGNFTNAATVINTNTTPSLTLKSNIMSASVSNVLVDVLINGVLNSTLTCNVNYTLPQFTLSPDLPVKINCGTNVSQTYTVNNTTSMPCNLSYVWNLGSNNGWQYHGIDATASISTPTNSITLTAPATAIALSNVSVTVYINGVAYTTLNSITDFITPTYKNNYSISGKPIICDNSIYSIPNLPSNASVIWSLPSGSGSTLQLTQNLPTKNQVTIKNNKYYGLNTNLIANIYGLSSTCQAPFKITKPIINDNSSTSMYQNYTYVQDACSYYNVSHPYYKGTITSNAAPVFIHQGCMVYVPIGDLPGTAVSIPPGYPKPTSWNLNPVSPYWSGNTLAFNLGIGTGGLPYMFKISNVGNGACYDTRTLLFFSISANGRFIVKQDKTTPGIIRIGLKENTTDEQSNLFFKASSLIKENVQTVSIIDKNGNILLQSSKVVQNEATLDLSSLPEDVYNIVINGNNDYVEQQQYIHTLSPSSNEVETRIAEDIANGKIDISADEAENRKDVLRQELYQSLQQDPSLTTNSSVLQDFIIASGQGSFGMIHQINNALINSDIVAAQNLMNSWTPTSQIELNCLKYYNYYISYLKGNSLSNQDLIDLFNLANLCPQSNGDIIYAVRSLYNNLTNTTEDFSSACQNFSLRSTKGIDIPNALQNSRGICIYPNPTKGNFIIKLPENTKGISDISINNVFGKRVMQMRTIAGAKSININNTITSGVYIVQITNNITGKMSTQKLIVE